MSVDDDMEQVQLLSVRRVCALTGRSRSSVYRDVRSGLFPPPIRVGAHAIAFRLGDITTWIESRPVAGVGGRA